MTGTCFERQVLSREHGRRLQAQEEDTNYRPSGPSGGGVRPGGWKAGGRTLCRHGISDNPCSWECAPPPVQGAQPGPQKDGSLVRTSHRGSAAHLCSPKAWAASSVCPKPSGPQFPHLCYCCLVTKSCLTLGHPKDCSLPRSFVNGISQARILEWVAISSSRGSS